MVRFTVSHLMRIWKNGMLISNLLNYKISSPLTLDNFACVVPLFATLTMYTEYQSTLEMIQKS